MFIYNILADNEAILQNLTPKTIIIVWSKWIMLLKRWKMIASKAVGGE